MCYTISNPARIYYVYLELGEKLNRFSKSKFIHFPETRWQDKHLIIYLEYYRKTVSRWTIFLLGLASVSVCYALSYSAYKSFAVNSYLRCYIASIRAIQLIKSSIKARSIVIRFCIADCCFYALKHCLYSTIPPSCELRLRLWI